MSKGIFTVQITKKGKDPVQWIREVTDKIHFELQNEIKLSADATAEIMKRILMGSGYKLDNLANTINAEILTSTGGISVGIGKISDLPKGEDGRDYWNAFNDGWLPPENWGYFGEVGNSPEKGASGEKWYHTGNRKDWYLIPKKPIEPLKFVDIGFEDLKKHLNKQIDKFLKN
jgi:hypothetical protein